MKRIKPVITCENCWAWADANEEFVDRCIIKNHKAFRGHTCRDAEPKEIGTCGECFWVGPPVNASEPVVSMNYCNGDKRCNGNVYNNPDGGTTWTTSPGNQGGPYWWPKEQTK